MTLSQHQLAAAGVSFLVRSQSSSLWLIAASAAHGVNRVALFSANQVVLISDCDCGVDQVVLFGVDRVVLLSDSD